MSPAEAPESASATGRFSRPGPRPFARAAAMTSAALAAAGNLFVPKCPRCGARHPRPDNSYLDERDGTFLVRCRNCHHQWLVIPHDPLLGP